MANLLKCIARAEKITGKKAVQKGQFYHFEYKGHDISFACNGRFSPEAEATCFYVKRHGLEDDLQTDYFAGVFRDNLAQCFKTVDRTGN